MAGLRKTDTLAQEHARLLALLIREHDAIGALLEGSTKAGAGTWHFSPMTFGAVLAAHDLVRLERGQLRRWERPEERKPFRGKVLRGLDDQDDDQDERTEDE